MGDIIAEKGKALPYLSKNHKSPGQDSDSRRRLELRDLPIDKK